MPEISRRTLNRTAWTLPVLAVAASAPASAASGSAAQPLMVYYTQPVADNQTSPISNKPFSSTNPELSLLSIIFAEPNGASDHVVSMTATIILPVDGLSFTATNGTSGTLEAGQADWHLPVGSSGTADLNGTTGYRYVFTWTGSAGPVDSFDYDGTSYSLFDYPDLPNLHVQITGGAVDPSMPVQSSLIVTTASGVSASRTSAVDTVGNFSQSVGDPL